MKHITSLFFIALVSISALAQSKADAERLFNAGNYTEAKDVYARLLTKRPNDALLNYCYARCLYEEGNIGAVRFFTEVANKYPESYRYMGMLYYNDYQFAEAEECFGNYLNLVGMKSNIATLQSKSAIGAEMLKHVEDVEVIDSIVVSKEVFLKHYALPQEAGRISSDTNGIVTYTTERNDRKFYSEVVDNQRDIYYTDRLLGEWSTPTSISGNINSDYDEDFPFMMADGITFYFASNREEGLGGYDIYMTRFNSNTNDYLPPQNIGMPFNSPANDYLFAVDETNGIGYFATDRYLTDDKVCIYRFLFHREKQMLKGTDYLTTRRRAQMLSTNHVAAAAPTIETPTTEKETNTAAQESAIHFVVNTEVTYTSINDFKSPRTRELYLELQTLIADQVALQQEVTTIRKQYRNTSDDEKENLRMTILTSERELASMQTLIRKQTILLRNEETQLINAQ